MSVTRSTNRYSLTISSVVYFGSALVIGLPVMYVVYWIFAGILHALNLGWFVPSAGGIVVVAAAFLVGMWVAGKVAERVISRLYRT